MSANYVDKCKCEPDCFGHLKTGSNVCSALSKPYPRGKCPFYKSQATFERDRIRYPFTGGSTHELEGLPDRPEKAWAEEWEYVTKMILKQAKKKRKGR